MENRFKTTAFLRVGAAALAAGVVLLLNACGGASSSSTETSSTTALERGAQLNRAELQEAEQRALAADASGSARVAGAEAENGGIVPKSAYVGGTVARKAAASAVAVFRFYNTVTRAHFYTTNEAEKNNVLLSAPYFSYDGAVFTASGTQTAGLSPVYRFFNRQTGVHFYTISEAEKNNVLTTLPQFQLEGPAYFASQVAGASLIPMYRFYLPSKGYHFYTASEEEKNQVMATLGQTYQYEGIGYYVLSDVPHSDKLPHTGVTSSQCYQDGSDSTVDCWSAGALAHSRTQDGQRNMINPLTYSQVGANPITSCVKDNLTGLIWEGKPGSGERAGGTTFTYYADGRAGDASAYVARVNQLGLCGFTDWRIPKSGELLGLLDFGAGGTVNATWFPNSNSGTGYWSSTEFPFWSIRFNVVGYGNGTVSAASENNSFQVRLVRGGRFSGVRYAVGTAAYPGDAANNVVNDLATGLQWRRCEEGRTWTGSACSGGMWLVDHAQAMDYLKALPGWRLPNAKELYSLVLDDVTNGLPVDPVAFPSALEGDFWSSTRLNSSAVELGIWSQMGGLMWTVGRYNTYGMRLVRLIQ